jgi:subtilisin family serine protease
MSWIIEPAENFFESVKNYCVDGPVKPIGAGFLVKSLDALPVPFHGRIWSNSRFTVPHEQDIGAAGGTEEEVNWGLADLELPKLWELTGKGEGIRIGVADSGVDITHPAFAHLDPSAVPFAAFDLETGERIDRLISDSGWHGTHCAGVLVGEGSPGLERGAAPASVLSVAQVLDEGWNGSVASIKAGLGWLREQRCDIVSLSLGWPGLHDEWASDIAALVNDGAIVVAAAGNEFGLPGTASSRSPANYVNEFIVSVGAYDSTRAIWKRSGGGEIEWPLASSFAGSPKVTIPALAGPGVDVVSSVPGNSFRSSSGTSMACPQIAGLIACLLSFARQAKVQGDTRQVVLDALFGCLVDRGDQGIDIRYGKGVPAGERLRTWIKEKWS